MMRLLLSCIVFICMARELFAQQMRRPDDPPALPTSMSLSGPAGIPFPKHTPEMVDEFLRTGTRMGLIEDIGDLVLLPVDLALDCVLSGIRVIGSVEDNTITSKVMRIDRKADVHLFSEFLTHFHNRESKFLAGINGSYLSNPGLEDGSATIDMDDFMVEQRKVIWDVLKKTYFAKYRFHAEERLHDDAFYINNWQGIDFVALPPFLAGYLYYRGLDKNFTIGDIRIRTLIEPGQRFLNNDIVGAMMIDIRPKNWPIGIIASMGLYDHKPELEFIGIGTTIDAVKKAIMLQQE